ncbi:Alpha/Beta hydrolase protein [Talaromyces proteolyticus]|uniref:Alpha/Beta hydrolase protein n=1 Tax=Talaromyces proteolyticus TaxID=1131652 RepID=A0AAD4KM46_9EURO|nr:Alpha/Beta hydrolase protein [Talaromyces proteolyticus]KAH8692301.1 Alpha/Beta hydrolase protein [Talaromyces proteolyticus]
MAVLASALYSYLALATSESSAPTEALHTRHYFYVGGEYVNIPGGHAFQNQMYVEKLTPQHGSSKPYPIVFVHGGDQTGTNFLNKPDGGRGWASWFLDRGYEVYIVDRTLTARSAYQPSSNLSLGIFSVEFISQRFTAVQNYPLWPQAKLHTQWPGTGEMGDPIFDNYYASNVQAVSDTIAQETTMKAAGEALLDKIGPAVVITHSQGGLYGWQWADNRPELVKALIQIEPKGPPFQEVIFSSAFDRPYGLTSIPLQYDPMPTNTSVPFETVVVPAPVNDSSLYPCLIQKEPASKLPNLAKVPILIETGEASYHATYDYCVIEFLKQAGVNAQHLELGKVGIHGNAHLQFMEKNSDDIAAVLHNWIVKTVK